MTKETITLLYQAIRKNLLAICVNTKCINCPLNADTKSVVFMEDNTFCESGCLLSLLSATFQHNMSKEDTK